MKINKKNPVLVVGAGSIGERHIKILLNEGFSNIYVLRRKKSKNFRNLFKPDITIITSWNSISTINFTFAIIANPSSLHMRSAISSLNRGMHVLVEKPLSNNLKSFRELKRIVKQKKLLVYVGYMMRFHPLIKKIDKFILKKTYGDVVSIESKWAEYLPDWHPWEDYKDSYASIKSLGGGAALTLSHDIDLVKYLSKSQVKKSYGIKNHINLLGIDVEGAVDIIINYKNGITSNSNLSFHQKNKERFLKILFEKAQVFINFEANLMKVYINRTKKITTHKVKNFDRNNLFIDQFRNFINIIESDDALHLISEDNIKNSEKIIKICNEA